VVLVLERAVLEILRPHHQAKETQVVMAGLELEEQPIVAVVAAAQVLLVQTAAVETQITVETVVLERHLQFPVRQ
jgi:hypothetical protein